MHVYVHESYGPLRQILRRGLVVVVVVVVVAVVVDGVHVRVLGAERDRWGRDGGKVALRWLHGTFTKTLRTS